MWLFTGNKNIISFSLCGSIGCQVTVRESARFRYLLLINRATNKFINIDKCVLEFDITTLAKIFMDL